MSDLKKAYESLEDAKARKIKLDERIANYQGIQEPLDELSKEFYIHFNLDDIKTRCEEGKKRAKLNILESILVYVVTFGIVDTLAFVLFKNSSMLWCSIGACLGSYWVIGDRYFKSLKENKGKLKNIKKIEDVIGGEPKYKGKTLREIIELVEDDINNKMEAARGTEEAIAEYESRLQEIHNEMATNIMRENGIEGTVTINSRPKSLTKRKKM